jgi:hypothetical protein
VIAFNMFIELIQNTFGDSKYKKWYISLIRRALLRVNYTLPSHKNQALRHLDRDNARAAAADCELLVDCAELLDGVFLSSAQAVLMLTASTVATKKRFITFL